MTKQKHFLRILQIVIFFFTSQNLVSQVYPVQVTTVLTPPYLANISEYSTTLNEKFFVNLFTNDLTITNRQVQLKVFLEGNNINAVSNPVINGYNPIYITGGEALTITNSDLAPYLQLQNLQGITPSQFSNSLPQGLYKFCVQVYDFATQQPISLKSCATAYFIVNDPPFLNLPINHENIAFLDPQNIFFSWTPRHINATNIEYEFTLVELQDNQAPSNYSFFIAQPLYQTTSSNNVLLYGPTEPLLIPGKKYAWRVKAKTQLGFGENATFQNNGYSEIYDFVFQGNCEKPQFTLAEVTSTTQTKIIWQANPNHVNYLVQYRKKNTTTWFDVQSTTTEVKLYDLEPQATYEFRVGGYCAGNVLSFSNINEFTQPNTNVNVVNCGILPTVDLSNQTLFNGDLGDGQVFIAGDFPIHVTEGSGTGSYSGKGWTRAPYLNNIKLAVVFTDIKINTSMQLVQGEVKAVYDPTWSNIADINSIIDQVENVLDQFQQDTDEHNYSVPFVITNPSNITVVNGQIVVTNPATGQTGATYDFDQGETTIITDSNGSVFAVSPNGEVLPQQGVGIGIPNASNTENISANGQVTGLSVAGIKVIFKRSSATGLESKYADDDGVPDNANTKVKALYKILPDNYKLYYKGIANAGKGIKSYDYVLAEITKTDASVNLDNLVFNKRGIAAEVVSSTTVGNTTTKILKVPVFNTTGKDELLALLTNGTDKKKVVGAMMVVPIKDVGEINVTLVPVKGATIPTDIAAQLNAIYNPTGAKLKITVTPNYETAITTLECGTSGVFANYTSEQSTFISTYKTANPTKENEYYVFVTSGIAPSRPISGFMPLHRQFGFVFGQQTGNEVKSNAIGGLATVIAHEIGHGVFELQHPWEKYNYNKDSGSTPWLMDYAQGNTLPYTYWQTISHPKTALYLFQGDDSGEQISDELLSTRFIESIKTNMILSKNDNNLQTNYLPDISLLQDVIIKSNFVDSFNYSINVPIKTTDNYEFTLKRFMLGQKEGQTSLNFKSVIDFWKDNEIIANNGDIVYYYPFSAQLSDSVKNILKGDFQTPPASIEKGILLVIKASDKQKFKEAVFDFENDIQKQENWLTNLNNNVTNKQYNNLQKYPHNALSLTNLSTRLNLYKDIVKKELPTTNSWFNRIFNDSDKEITYVSLLQSIVNDQTKDKNTSLFTKFCLEDFDHIFDEINDEATKEKLYKVVSKLAGNSDQTIVFTNFKSLIQNGTVNQSKSNFLASILMSVEKNDSPQSKANILTFFNSNSLILKNLFSKLVIIDQEYFIKYLSKWSVAFYAEEYLNIENEIKLDQISQGYDTNLNEIQYLKRNSFGLNYDYVTLCPNNNLAGQDFCKVFQTDLNNVVNPNSNYYFNNGFVKKDNQTNILNSVIYYKSGKPLSDFVNIIFNEDFNYAGIKKGNQITVPLFWAENFAKKHNDHLSGKSLTIALETLTLFSIPFTGGLSSVAFYGSMGISAAAITIQLSENSILSYQYGQEFMTSFNTLQILTGAGLIVTSIGGLPKLEVNLSQFRNYIKNANFNDLLKIRNDLKIFVGNSMKFGSKIQNYNLSSFKTILFEIDLQLAFKTSLSNIKYSLKNNTIACFTRLNTEYEIATLSYLDALNNKNLLFTPINGIQIINSAQGYSKVGYYENVFIRENNIIKNKNIEIYLDNGTIKLFLSEVQGAGNRLFRSIDDFKTAIANGDNVFYIGKHSDITPRPTGVNGIAESHHGVNSVWMKEKYIDYGTGNNAPTVYMLKNPNHNATRGEFNKWAAEVRAKQGTSTIDYAKVTEQDMINLANRQFDVADVPQIVRDEYFNLWNDYKLTLTFK